MGTIETTIADEAYNMAIRIAYGNSKLLAFASTVKCTDLIQIRPSKLSSNLLYPMLLSLTQVTSAILLPLMPTL